MPSCLYSALIKIFSIQKQITKVKLTNEKKININSEYLLKEKKYF